jgi:hypothetical protein
VSPPRTKDRYPVLGWREWVELPGLGGARLKAKIDTGARTSALHAFDLELSEAEGVAIATFELHPLQRSARHAVRVAAEVAEFRKVRSSNGRVERRPVIRTEVTLGDVTWPVEVTLTSRDEMGFRMLLGRTAVRRRFLVDPGRSYLRSQREHSERGEQ